jgi:hypothetical protein
VVPGKIFISYRRDDVAGDARGIRDALAAKFGKSNVFMDVDDLLAGQRFDRELARALDDCDVLIAVIGRHWMEQLRAKTDSGERDYVREEIAAALRRDLVTIPVRVGLEGRLPSLPRGADLPDDIRDLVLHQKHDVTHERFGRDVVDLIEAIEAARARAEPVPSDVPELAEGAEKNSKGSPVETQRRRSALFYLGLIAGVVAIPVYVSTILEERRAEGERRATEGARRAAEAKRKADNEEQARVETQFSRPSSVPGIILQHAARQPPKLTPPPPPAEVTLGLPPPTEKAPREEIPPRWVAVLSSQKSRMDALRVFADMHQKYGDVLEGKAHDVLEIDLSARGLGTSYRLVVGPWGSRDAASGVCSQLTSAGYVGCWVTEF